MELIFGSNQLYELLRFSIIFQNFVFFNFFKIIDFVSHISRRQSNETKYSFYQWIAMEFPTNIVLGIFEYHASFIFCKISTNGS